MRRAGGTYLAALALAALAAVGCARAAGSSIFVYGPYPGLEDEALLGRVTAASRARGYEALIEPSDGRVIVPASWQGRRGERAHFVVQLYRGGWVQVRPDGPVVRRGAGGRVELPSELRTEYEAFALGLLEPPGGGP